MEIFFSNGGVFWSTPFIVSQSSCTVRQLVSRWVSQSACGCRRIGEMLLGHVDVVCEESAIECGAAYPEQFSGLCPVPLSLLERSK